MTVTPEAPEATVPQPIRLTPLAMLQLEYAKRVGRIRGIKIAKTFVGLQLTDGSILKLTSEDMAWAAIRAMTSAAHAGKTPRQARDAERVSFGSAYADNTEGN